MTVSLDGFVETRGGNIDWTMPDEGLFRFLNDYARQLGAFLYGRRTYQWRAKPKVVFSKTLGSVGHNSRLAREDVAAEVARTKQEVRGDLGVCGPTLAATFMQRGLIEEYRLFVRPIVLGGGKPYFTALDGPIALRLAETRAFPGGVVLLRYERALAPAIAFSSWARLQAMGSNWTRASAERDARKIAPRRGRAR
jgi:dihydrofolate reductase